MAGMSGAGLGAGPGRAGMSDVREEKEGRGCEGRQQEGICGKARSEREGPLVMECGGVSGRQ